MPPESDSEQAERDPLEPLHVLICGWKTRQFMSALCRELDRGRTQLPRGSHVTFFNEHPPETLDSVEDHVRCALAISINPPSCRYHGATGLSATIFCL